MRRRPVVVVVEGIVQRQPVGTPEIVQEPEVVGIVGDAAAAVQFLVVVQPDVAHEVQHQFQMASLGSASGLDSMSQMDCQTLAVVSLVAAVAVQENGSRRAQLELQHPEEVAVG